MGFAASVRAQLERKLFGRTDFTAPATLYAAAYISGVESTATGYARVAVANNTTSFPAASPLVNGIAIDWPVVASAMTNVDSVRFYDAPTAGNEVGRSADFTPVTVAINGFLHIAAGALAVSVT